MQGDVLELHLCFECAHQFNDVLLLSKKCRTSYEEPNMQLSKLEVILETGDDEFAVKVEERLEDVGDIRLQQQPIVRLARLQSVPVEANSQEAAIVNSPLMETQDVGESSTFQEETAITKPCLKKHTTPISFKCQFCIRTFKNIKLRAAHQKLQHLKKQKEPEKKLDTRTKFQCLACKKELSSKFSLNQHVLNSHEGKITYCKYCGISMTKMTSEEIKAHMQKGHNYSCDQCAFKTQYKSVILKHNRAVHEKELNYECKLCALKFFAIANGLKHLFSHGNTKQFSCHICSNDFSHPMGINKHYASDHGIRGTNKQIMKMVIKNNPDHGKQFLRFIGTHHRRSK